MSGRGTAGGILIEFLGMPGVGKTTLARGIVTDLRQHGYDALFLGMDAPVKLNRYIKLMRQVGAIGRYAATRPCQALRAARVLRGFPQPNVITYSKVMRYWLLTHAVIHRSRGQADIVVCDQGYYQGLYSLARLSPAPDQASFCAALQRIPTPELAVLVTADQQTVRARLRGRQHDHRSIDQLLLRDRRYLDRSGQIVHAIQVALRATDHSLIVYATSPSAIADTQELAASIRRHLHNSTGTGDAPARENRSQVA
jgi:thymidylate kinase